MENFESKYFRGQGPLFIGARDAAGAPEDLLFVGDLSSAEMEPQVERFEVQETVSGIGGTGASGIKSVKYGLSIVLRSIKPEHLALALDADLVVAGASSVTDESHTVKIGRFSPLKYTNVSSVVVKGAGGTPTYVEDTDYKVHGEEGMIEWLSGGTVVDDDEVLVDYSYAAQHHLKANPANKDVYLVFSGMNTADNNKQTRCEVYKAQIDPSALNFITEDTAEMNLSGMVLRDTLRAQNDQFFAWKTED